MQPLARSYQVDKTWYILNTNLNSTNRFEDLKNMKCSIHVGHGGAKHNDRNFDLSKTEHIDFDRSRDNLYWTYQNKTFSHDMCSFETVEREFYQEQYGQWLDECNKRYKAQRHPERIRTMEQVYQGRTTKPHEMILQIGNMDSHATPEQLKDTVSRFLDSIQSKYHERVHVLDVAIHLDEATPHAHLRYVVDVEREDGLSQPALSKGLKALGFDRPDLSKGESQYNNAQMTFTAKIRADFERFAGRCIGQEIDIVRQPTPQKSLTLEKMAHTKNTQERQAIERMRYEQTARTMEQDARARDLGRKQRVIDKQQQEIETLIKQAEEQKRIADERMDKLMTFKRGMDGIRQYGEMLQELGGMTSIEHIQSAFGVSPSDASKIYRMIESLPKPERVNSRANHHTIDRGYERDDL